MRSVNLSPSSSSAAFSWSRCVSPALALFVALAGCTSLTTNSLTDDLGGGGGDVDLSTSMVQGCKSCTSGQVCVEGACVNVPAKCPCPKETYCDLASNLCKVGCTVDGECTTGRICNVARTCQVGCRKDDVCGTGNICDNTLCRPGCRKDTECGSGNICATPANKCVAGCRKDMDCGSGNLCDAASNTCQKGCRKDGDCTTAGQICDAASLMCRPGCRATATCPNEQVCDLASSKCIAGCDTDARCNAGRMCDKAMCVDGCRTSATCALGTYCDTTMTKQCQPGCNGDKTRCPVGEACVAFLGSPPYRCQAQCFGWECNGTGWTCFQQNSDYANAHCRLGCTTDTDCSGGQRCTWFTYSFTMPGSYPGRYCAQPCTTAGCTTCIDRTGMSGTGTCDTTTKGCVNGTSICYQVSPSYGL